MNKHVLSIEDRQRIRLGLLTLVIGFLLLIAKFIAFDWTQSRAILSDALESVVNISGALISLLTVYIASKPADKDHPYGHGKAEYFSVAFEGGLICFAAVLILVDAVKAYYRGNEVHELNSGMIIVCGAGLINGALGFYLKMRGKKLKSLALSGSGDHLISDFVTSLGLVVGLFLIKVTGFMWIDVAMAASIGILFAFTGFNLVKKSLSGLMDGEDLAMIKQLGKLFQKHAFPGIIRIHHTRVVRSGRYHHVDAHLVVPEFWSVEKAHDETVRFEKSVIKEYEFDGEMHLHLDPCRRAYCEVCDLGECPVRQEKFEKRLAFTLEELTDPQEPQRFRN